MCVEAGFYQIQSQMIYRLQLMISYLQTLLTPPPSATKLIYMLLLTVLELAVAGWKPFLNQLWAWPCLHTILLLLSVYGWVLLFLFCMCLSVIDQFGDHFLGCSYGPLHIQHHNALVYIVHHALLQGHPSVLREQGIASDQSHPRDI